MKQIVQNFRTGELKVDEVPAPLVRAGGVLVANCFSLISAGTEKSTVSVARKNLVGKAMDRPDLVQKVIGKIKKDGLAETMRMVFARLDTPAALGYSTAGVVTEVGKNVSGFNAGDRVACAGQNFASHAEMVYIPKNLCVKVPEGVDLADASYVALGAIALQGVRQADPKLGEVVAVIGLGLLGQITVQALKANGCAVIASDLDPGKLKLASGFGADIAVLPDEITDAAAVLTHGRGVDAVIIAASTKEDGPVRVAGDICRKKGRVVVVGSVGMNIPREMYYLKELELRLSTSYGPGRYDPEFEVQGHDYPYGYIRWTEQRNMGEFLSLIQRGKMDVKTLTSHRFDIAVADRAYKLMMEGSEPYLGILLKYEGEPSHTPQRKIMLSPGKPLARLNLGIIGAGNHVKDMLIPELKKFSGVTLRAVCTGTGVNAKAIADKIQAGYCTTDFHEVLRDPDVNAVLIGTRHNSHASMVREALLAGKHVFVEKPLCLTEDELEEITGAYEEKAKDGLRLLVGFNRRYSPHAVRAKEFLAGRRNPLVMNYRVNAGVIPAEHWIHDTAVGGGRILGEACHFVDYMQAMCGAPPVSVHTRAIATHSSGITDDQCVITLTFGDGSVGTILYTGGGDVGLSKERFEAFGDGRSLTMDDFSISHFYHHRKVVKFKTSTRDKGFAHEMAAFVDEVLKSGTPSMAFAEIAATTRACLYAVKSLRTGQAYSF